MGAGEQKKRNKKEAALLGQLFFFQKLLYVCTNIKINSDQL